MLFGVLSASAQAPDALPVTIGALLPLTGSMSSSGVAGQAAVTMAAEDIEPYLARQGTPCDVTVRIEDTGTDPVQALAKLQLLASEGIRIVIGPYASECVAAVKDFADQNGILILSPASSAVSLSIPGDNIYRLVSDDSAQGLAIAYYLRSLGISTVVPIYMDDTFGNSLYASTKQRFEQYGGTYTTGVKFDPNAVDLSAQVQELNAQIEQAAAQVTSASVAVHVIAYEQTVSIFDQASNFPALSGVLWIGNDGITEDHRILQDPVAAAFAVTTKFLSPIFRRDDSAVAYIPSYPMTQHIMKSFRDRLGRNGDEFAINAYDAVWISVLVALRSGNSSDIHELETALFQYEGVYRGYLANVDFNEAGDRDTGAYGFYSVYKNADNSYRWSITGSFRFLNGAPVSQNPLQKRALAIPADMANFTIAALVPLTGELAEAGQSAVQALQTAVADFNSFLEDEGSAGRVQLQVEDTQTDPQVALAKLQQIAQGNAARVVIGPFASSCLEAVAPYANQNGILLISPASTAMNLGIAGDNIYRMILNNEREAQALAGFLQHYCIQAVVPMWRNDSYGNDLRDNFTAEFLKVGGTVYEGVPYQPGTADFSASLSALHDQVSQAVAHFGSDAVAVELISFEEAEQILAAIAQDPVLQSAGWIGCDANARLEGILNNPIARNSGLEVSYVAPVFSPDFIMSYEVTPPEPLVKADVQNYITSCIQTYGHEPNVYDYGTYDSLWLAAYTHLRAGKNAKNAKVLNTQFNIVAYIFIGYSGLSNLNDEGDKEYGFFGFSTLTEDEGTYGWDYIGCYYITARQGAMYLPYGPRGASGTCDWELYE